MVVALLVVIVLILLFGAGVVKGWLKNILWWALGLVLLACLILAVLSLFGEEVLYWIVFGGGGLLFFAALWVKTESTEAKAAQLSRDNRRREREANKAGVSEINEQDEVPARDRVWGWYKGEIESHWPDAARQRARSLYDANDVRGLERYCRMQSKLR